MKTGINKPALVIIDMLNDYFDGSEVYDRDRLTNSIKQLVDSARTSSSPVIWVRQQFEPTLEDAFLDMRTRQIAITIRDTRGCELLAEFNVHPTDYQIIKKRYSAFYGTTLDELLGELAVDCLVVAGINTHACIRMTAIDAYQRDLLVVISSDCVASYDQEHHAISLRYMDGKIGRVLSNDEIIAQVFRR